MSENIQQYPKKREPDRDEPPPPKKARILEREPAASITEVTQELPDYWREFLGSRKISPTDLSIAETIALFDLKPQTPWEPPDAPLEPLSVQRFYDQIRVLNKAGYPHPTRSHARVSLLLQYATASARLTLPPNPANTAHPHPFLPKDLQVDIFKPGEQTLRLSGTIDLEMPTGIKQTPLIGVRHDERGRPGFWEAQDRLLVYLAVLRQLKLQQKVGNAFVQGFVSDGLKYSFVAIEHEGKVRISERFDNRKREHLRVIHSWVVWMMQGKTESEVQKVMEEDVVMGDSVEGKVPGEIQVRVRTEGDQYD